jgi:hypothetical protein
MALAKHHPSKVYKRNRGVLAMTKAQLSEFASVPEAGLVRKRKKKKR